jgi:glycerate 2-kinase
MSLKFSRANASAIFDAAVKVVQPNQLLASQLINEDDSLTICGKRFNKIELNKIYVIGAGKAAAAMAVATEHLLGDLITAGVVTTKYGHRLPTTKIKILEAAHPIPDENSIEAVTETLNLLKNVKSEDLIICLISGGASSLWCDLPEGISLMDLQTTAQELIKSGASIDEINVVRKQLSDIKGGKLINYCNGAKVFSLIISDVVSNDLSIIASGPTIADFSTFADALASIKKYGLQDVIPSNVLKYLAKGLIQKIKLPNNQALFKNVYNQIIGSNQIAIAAAAQQAKNLGYQTIVIAEPIIGDVEVEAKKLVELALASKGENPICIVQGGEATLKVTGSGKGGRNQHFALAALNELKEKKIALGTLPQITIVSAGTDGTDGPTDATGGIIDTETFGIALRRNLDIVNELKNHNSYVFLKETGGLIVTGPTQTNVMDIMFALIY